LPKPFNERELVARMRAILRRASAPVETPNAAPAEAPAASDRICVGDVTLEMGARRTRRDGQIIELTAVEFDLLALLLRSAGNVVTRQSIAREVLDRQLLPFDRSIDTHMSNLRRKLGSHLDSGERIKTLRSIGYIYVVNSG
ncbi:MAG: two-component system, OmpR family, response regulator CpxR, partial [Abditibacteriota bacterium]|nr:two-component system, OmpR family, response regulator CpxR [Abditibacteriota bacterium]